VAVVGLIALAATGLTACSPNNHNLALVGSDTIVDLDGPLSSQFNALNGPDKAYNVPSVLTGSNTFTVPGDKQCGQQVYDSTSNPPPNGSGAGKNALAADTTGCVDIARSSSGRGASDPASFEYYAFAKDAVSWARFSGGHAPANLTQDQLKGIYLCDQPGGKPRFTNWNQVGGAAGTIIRYLPQTGSGTLSFFETRILGLTAAQQGVLDDTSCTGVPRPTRVEENHGNQVAAANRPNAILPYSFAQWTAQQNGVIPDDRAGSIEGQIGGVTPNATTINNGTFLGRRWVYHVLKNTSPSYAAALTYAGVTSSANGYVCSDAAQATITQYGFVTNATAPAGPGLVNSHCRKDPTAL
jgi:phosphate transport system substrate-binding protein